MNVFIIEVVEDGNIRTYPFRFYKDRGQAIEEARKIRPIPENISIKKLSFNDQDILFELLVRMVNGPIEVEKFAEKWGVIASVECL